MTDAVIVSTARTGLAKSWRGALNNTHGATMGGHVVKHAMERAKVDPGEVEDVIMGCANPEGATGWNIARQVAVAAPLGAWPGKVLSCCAGPCTRPLCSPGGPVPPITPTSGRSRNASTANSLCCPWPGS